MLGHFYRGNVLQTPRKNRRHANDRLRMLCRQSNGGGFVHRSWRIHHEDRHGESGVGLRCRGSGRSGCGRSCGETLGAKGRRGRRLDRGRFVRARGRLVFDATHDLGCANQSVGAVYDRASFKTNSRLLQRENIVVGAASSVGPHGAKPHGAAGGFHFDRASPGIFEYKLSHVLRM